MHLGAVEHCDALVFLHAVKPGPASQSYGIKVAALAGEPKPVIEMAKRKLVRFEQQQPLLPPQLDLFAQPQPEPDPTLVAIAQGLEKIDPDSLAPREALDTLYAGLARSAARDGWKHPKQRCAERGETQVKQAKAHCTDYSNCQPRLNRIVAGSLQHTARACCYA